MFRIDTPNKKVDLFGAGKHGFRDGDMALGINPTELSAAQQNALQEEILGVIEAAGVVPNKANNAQLVEALQLIIDSRGQIVGKNKLLNTNFENPVNQLGKASRVTTAGAYNFDCWYYGANLKFYQAADYLNLSASQQYTLNWAGTATAEYLITAARSTTIEAQGGWTAIAKGAQLTTPADVISSFKYLWIRWTGVTAALATFDKPQLEEGSIATTHESKFFDKNLRECQRYYEQTWDAGTLPAAGGNYPGLIRGNSLISDPSSITGFVFSVTKRTTPTLVFYNPVTGVAGHVYRESDAASIAVAGHQYTGNRGLGSVQIATPLNMSYLYHCAASSRI